MTTREEVEALFPHMQEKFDPAKAEGLDAVIQFELTGEGGGKYWIKISDSTLTYGEGTDPAARMTVRGSTDDFVALMNGKLQPMQAFMLGKIKVAGDTGLAMKLMPLIS
ncbi:MAG: SCP2 sterol-binding domain-containing protein [Anaerolineae bacterium]